MSGYQAGPECTQILLLGRLFKFVTDPAPLWWMTNGHWMRSNIIHWVDQSN